VKLTWSHAKAIPRDVLSKSAGRSVAVIKAAVTVWYSEALTASYRCSEFNAVVGF
jgi:hypothetical protein